MYDLLLQHGTVIDPSQQIHALRDIAIANGRVAAIGENLGEARDVIDVGGQYVTPGLVDIHTHIYAGVTTWGVKPDPACLRTGVTTVVDAGSPSWATFPGFRWYIAEPAKTRVLSFVHISGIGLVYGPCGESTDLDYMDVDRCARAVVENPEIAAGVKVRQGIAQVRQNGVEPLRLAVEAAEQAKTRVMVHIGAGVPLFKVLELLRPGDIVTHCFQGRGDIILDDYRKVQRFVREARDRGVVMDVGHGAGSFHWDVARDALDDGFLPDVISTDLHTGNIYGPVYDMPTTMSKFLLLGLSIDQVVEFATINAARAVGRDDVAGSLAVGRPADIAVLTMDEGEFDFYDTHKNVRRGNQKLRAALTVRGGVVYRPDDIQAESEEAIKKRFAVSKKDMAALGIMK